MYSPETITALENRIGWGKPQDPAFVIELTEANSVGTSGRTITSFHQLVKVENLYAALDQGTVSAEDFNAILADIRKQAVLSVLPMIMDNNADYLNVVDYSRTIEDNILLFDEAIGYKMAIMVLEKFITTTRMNFHERNAKLAIGNLKLEIEGFRNDKGSLVAVGISQKLNAAINKAIKKLWPIRPIVTSQQIC